jgi:hypothetical protein
LSSTSYTPDEDFMKLVDALDILDKRIKQEKAKNESYEFPKLQFIVTGKGP